MLDHDRLRTEWEREHIVPGAFGRWCKRVASRALMFVAAILATGGPKP